MNAQNLNKLVEVANSRIFTDTGQPLTEIQTQILLQALAGKKLKDIQVQGYSETTVQRVFSPKLWQLLSNALGQKVGIKNIRLILESLDQTTAPPMEVSRSTAISNSSFKPILHNLPASTCTQFIGRTQELKRLLELLSTRHAAHIISVDGIGGVGKTTLVLEACYRCLQASLQEMTTTTIAQHSAIPKFDAIIFTSAKEFRLTSAGLLNRLCPHRTLTDIFRQMGRVIDELCLVGMTFEEQFESIQDTLAQYRTLLVVDNLETVPEPEEVLAFLYELPPTVKTIITTREQIIFVPVRLPPLEKLDGLTLIQHEAEEKGVGLTDEDCLELYRATGGIPIAISYATGQLATGYSIAEVLHQLKQSTGQVAQFCFASSVQPLRGKPAHFLLMALTFFPEPASPDALIQIAIPQADAEIAQQALARLRGLSLVNQAQQRYSLLPLTHEYALAELTAYPKFSQEARQRWLAWYVNFSDTHSTVDVDEWSGDRFEDFAAEWPNLQAVMEWCLMNNCYSEALQLWRNLETYTQFRGRNISRLGYWDDRLFWTTSLMQMAEQQGDLSALAQLGLEKAWTLNAIGKPGLHEAAEQLLLQIWDFRHHQDSLFQMKLARSIAITAMAQNQFEMAECWLERVDELLQKFPQPDNLEYNRLAARLPGDLARIRVQAGDYEQAKVLFMQSLDWARRLHWVRHFHIIRCCLAEVAISQGRLEEAQTLLEDNVHLAAANHDRTHLAFCQRVMSKLAWALENSSEAIYWGKLALETFNELGIESQVRITHGLLLSFEG